MCDEGRGVVASGLGVYLDFADAIERMGENTVRERYGNLFNMYEKITGSNAYKNPMTIYPAVHYTMGGLWVDYNLMSNLRVCLQSEKRTFPIMVQTALVPVPSYRAWLTVTLYCLTQLVST